MKGLVSEKKSKSKDISLNKMSDSRSTAVMESQEVLEHTNLSAALLARELERKSVKELREICVSKGIDTSTCVDKRDLVDIIVNKPIAAAADPIQIGLDVLADVAVHSLPAETGLNGLQGVCRLVTAKLPCRVHSSRRTDCL